MRAPVIIRDVAADGAVAAAGAGAEMRMVRTCACVRLVVYPTTLATRRFGSGSQRKDDLHMRSLPPPQRREQKQLQQHHHTYRLRHCEWIVRAYSLFPRYGGADTPNSKAQRKRE